MQFCFSRHCLLLACLALAALDARGDFNQLQAISAAQVINKQGSDTSLQTSTTNAMRALMDLANQNTSSALKNGYKAYGQYQNSGTLDNLRVQNAITALNMDSVGEFISHSPDQSAPFLAPVGSFKTTFARLDPTFLRQGEAGQVADQFEKATGMKRETFLKNMAVASETPLTANDPQIMSKVMGKFNDFMGQIPNADFRKKVQKEIDSVPSWMRSQVIAKGVQIATSVLASNNANKTNLNVAEKNSPAKAALAAAAPAAAEKAGDPAVETKRDPASTVTAGLDGKPETHSVELDKLGTDAVGGVLQTAIEEQNSVDSIFKQISRKIRGIAATWQKRPPT